MGVDLPDIRIEELVGCSSARKIRLLEDFRRFLDGGMLAETIGRVAEAVRGVLARLERRNAGFSRGFQNVPGRWLSHGRDNIG